MVLEHCIEVYLPQHWDSVSHLQYHSGLILIMHDFSISSAIKVVDLNYCSGYGQGCKLIADYKEKDINKLSLGELSLAGAYTGNNSTTYIQCKMWRN